MMDFSKNGHSNPEALDAKKKRAETQQIFVRERRTRRRIFLSIGIVILTLVIVFLLLRTRL